jgi:hypothetical protein
MFLRLQTQWRATSGALMGLDYVAAEWLFNLYQVENPADLLEDLQTMEGRIVETLNSRKGS